MTTIVAIPGARELVGKGVYCGVPKDIPQPGGNRNAVVTGAPTQCEWAARQLEEAGWHVTVVIPERTDGGIHRRCRWIFGTDVVCASGIEYLEAVVLRGVQTGRIEACNVSAMFLL